MLKPTTPRQVVTPARLQWVDQQPFSLDYGDIYFSKGGGFHESRYVFLDGNGLPERWQDQHFTIAEIGFGTGLNFLSVLHQFETTPWASLTYVGIEKHPLLPDDLVKAHLFFPELAFFGKELQRIYPPVSPGVFRGVLPLFRCELVLIFDDALFAIDQLKKPVDAWFLDGFAPSLNPDLWSGVLCQKIFQKTKPSGTFATYSVARQVRNSLSEAGFQLLRRKGFAQKRHMLQGKKLEADFKGGCG